MTPNLTNHIEFYQGCSINPLSFVCYPTTGLPFHSKWQIIESTFLLTELDEMMN